MMLTVFAWNVVGCAQLRGSGRQRLNPLNGIGRPPGLPINAVPQKVWVWVCAQGWGEVEGKE